MVERIESKRFKFLVRLSVVCGFWFVIWHAVLWYLLRSHDYDSEAHLRQLGLYELPIVLAIYLAIDSLLARLFKVKPAISVALGCVAAAALFYPLLPVALFLAVLLRGLGIPY